MCWPAGQSPRAVGRPVQPHGAGDRRPGRPSYRCPGALPCSPRSGRIGPRADTTLPSGQDTPPWCMSAWEPLKSTVMDQSPPSFGTGDHIAETGGVV